MPITRLFVEGNLDSEILTALLQGRPIVQRGGSKNSLRPQAIGERRQNKVDAGYLRDRDFDSEPSEDRHIAVAEPPFENQVIGCTGIDTNLRI